jgi:hypothetical protein
MVIPYTAVDEQSGNSYYRFEFRESRGGHSSIVGFLRIDVNDGKIYQQSLPDIDTSNWRLITQYDPVQDSAPHSAADYASAYLGILGQEPYKASDDLYTYNGNVAIENVSGDTTPELIFVSYHGNPNYPGLPSDTYEDANLNIYTYENGAARQIADSKSLGIRLNGWDAFRYTKVFLSNNNELCIFNAAGQWASDFAYVKYEMADGKLVKTDIISKTVTSGSGSDHQHNGANISKAEYDSLEKAIISSANTMLLETYNSSAPEVDENYANTSSLKRVAMTYDQAMERLRSPATAPAALVAAPAASTVLVNGKNIAFDAYNIDGANYFKLRDLACALSGTEKQFDVGWDGAANAIALTSGRAYTVAGGEMTGKGAGSKTPTPTMSKVTLDGAEVSFTAYNIDGNNYFKLRDMGAALNFSVGWDASKNTVAIDT